MILIEDLDLDPQQCYCVNAHNFFFDKPMKQYRFLYILPKEKHNSGLYINQGNQEFTQITIVRSYQKKNSKIDLKYEVAI
jgi:hypothetical protein